MAAKVGVDVGTDVGTDVDTEIATEIATGVGTDVGTDAGVEVGVDKVVADASDLRSMLQEIDLEHLESALAKTGVRSMDDFVNLNLDNDMIESIEEALGGPLIALDRRKLQCFGLDYESPTRRTMVPEIPSDRLELLERMDGKHGCGFGCLVFFPLETSG